MKKPLKLILSLILTGTMLVGTFSGCTSKKSDSADKELNLYTWEGMFPPEVLEGFTEETGIKVNFSNFDTDETMLSKLETAKGGDYDLVIADDYILQTVISEELATKLDTSKIPNLKNVNPVYQGQFFDPNNEYTVPYGAGVQTIVYDPSVVTKKITSYADLWDEGLKDSIGITNNYRVIVGMALKTMGESYNTEDIAVLEKASEKLTALAPNIRMIQDDNLQDSLISGEVSTAVMYTSQVTLAKLANPDLEVVIPTEGVGYGIMAQFIPSKAPHAEAAYKFIDYILEGENAAKCSEYIGYYSTNTAGDALISEDFKSFLTLPTDLDMGTSEMIQPVGTEASAELEKIWTTFKSSTGK